MMTKLATSKVMMVVSKTLRLTRWAKGRAKEKRKNVIAAVKTAMICSTGAIYVDVEAHQSMDEGIQK